MNRLMLIVGLLVFIQPNSWSWYDTRYGVENNLPDYSDKRELKYNPYTGERSYQPKEAVIKYNPYESRWDYKLPNEGFRYNPYENRWE